MAAKEKELEFIEYVVKALVDNPDKVEIARSVDDRGVLLELTVDPEDMGKIIGKAGATAKSIRTLLRVLGAKDDARYNLKIVEPEGSEYVRPDDQDQAQDQGQDQDQDQAAPAEEASDEAPTTEEAPADSSSEASAQDEEAAPAEEAPAAEEAPVDEAPADEAPVAEATDTKAADIKAKAREGIEDLDTDI